MALASGTRLLVIWVYVLVKLSRFPSIERNIPRLLGTKLVKYNISPHAPNKTLKSLGN